MKQCPECGCPVTNETVCPECGHSFINNEESSSRPYENKIKRLYHKYFYTEDADPYVDFAAKIFSVPKVVITIIYILWVLLLFLAIIGFGGIFGGFFGSEFRSAFYSNSILWGSALLELIFMTIFCGLGYLFWWWVGKIVVDGVRKIRQSKNK